LRYFSALCCVTSIAFAAQSYTITPVGQLQFRFEDKSKDYTPLGALYLQDDGISYSDYIVGGTFGFKSSFDNYDLNSLLYGVGRLKDKDTNSLKNEKTFYANNGDKFLYIGELNIKRDFNTQSITIGRQSYKSNLVNDNYRITKNSYEGLRYDYENQNFTLQSLYFNKIASSTLSNSVPFNHKYGFLGYGFGYDTSGFTTISKHIINKDLSTDGAVHLLARYGKEDKYISFENLLVDDLFNTSSVVFAYNINSIYLKAGAIYQTSIGDNHIEKYIESSQQGKSLKAKHYQSKIQYKKNKLKLTYTITYTPYDDDSIYQGTLFSPFSNHASWLRGLNTSHAIIADTVSQKFSITDLVYIDKLPVLLSTAYVK